MTTSALANPVSASRSVSSSTRPTPIGLKQAFTPPSFVLTQGKKEMSSPPHSKSPSGAPPVPATFSPTSLAVFEILPESQQDAILEMVCNGMPPKDAVAIIIRHVEPAPDEYPDDS